MKKKIKIEEFGLPLEMAISNQIYEAIQGDMVGQIIKTGKINLSGNYLRSMLEGHSFKVEASTLPHYYELFNSVKEKLGFTGKVDFYITGDASVNAYTVAGDNEDEPSIINVNSSLIDLMTDDEIRFVIGHEFGHLITKNTELLRLIHFVFPDFKTPPITLQYKVRLWQQLSELVADRYGFYAMPNIDVCISAFFKMSSGLDFEKMKMKVEAFLEENNRRLEYFRNDKGMNVATHPINPIRVQALNVFSKSEFFVNKGISKEEMQVQMDELTSILLKIRNSEVDVYMAQFIATAGLIIASVDAERVTDDEVEQILMELSAIQIFPQEYLNEIAQQDVNAIFQESIAKILETNPEMREGMLRYLIEIAMSDNSIKDKEVNAVFNIGQQMLGYHSIEIAQIFAQMIQQNFEPDLDDIC